MQAEAHKGMSTSTSHQSPLRILFIYEALSPDNMHTFTEHKAQSVHTNGTSDAVNTYGDAARER